MDESKVRKPESEESENALGAEARPGSSCSRPGSGGELVFACDARVYLPLEEDASPIDERAIQRFQNLHQGQRCFIVGNGPSLNATDLSLLDGEITIGVNGIFYKTDECGFRPTYYVVEDSRVMEDNLDRIRSYKVTHKFFPSIYRRFNVGGPDVSFFRMNRGFYEKRGPNYGIPRFSTDLTQRAFCGQSVTFINLQLAWYMGFSEVYLIGVDFSYRIPESAKVDGLVITSTEDDPNHFHPAYFGKGKRWADPQLDRVERNYVLADLVFRWSGRRIYNATIGGKLEVFERVDYGQLFPEDRPRIDKVSIPPLPPEEVGGRAGSSPSSRPVQGKEPSEIRHANWLPFRNSRAWRRASYMSRQILRWHTRWAGLAMLLALALVNVALWGWPVAAVTVSGSVVTVFATIAYVSVRSSTDLKSLASRTTEIDKGLRRTVEETSRLARSLKPEIDSAIRAATETLSTVEEEKRASLKRSVEEGLASIREDLSKETKDRKQAITIRDRRAYQEFRRRLEPGAEKRFLEDWGPRLGLQTLMPRQLRYLSERISHLERLCQGRLAGHIEDAILRVLVGLSLKGNRINILEIGTLFGVNAVILHDLLSCYFEEVHLTLIDPLSGYYGPHGDVNTGLPVRRDVVERNLRLAMVPLDDVRIIQAYSEDGDAREQAADREYHLLFVDGDHSYEGVARDFELYAPLVAMGGYIVFDDYQNKTWPEVTRAVDEVVKKSPLVIHRGDDWESAVFQIDRDNQQSSASEGTSASGGEDSVRDASPPQASSCDL